MVVNDTDMGRVNAHVKLTNSADLQHARDGLRPFHTIRTLDIEVLVDTGATMLFLPADVVARLGIPYERARKVRYADARIGEVPWVGGVRLEVLGREMVCDALVGPEGTTPPLGQIQLDELD